MAHLAEVIRLEVPTQEETFEDYLVGLGMAPKTIHIYGQRYRWVLRMVDQLGVDLATADARTLAYITSRSAGSHSMRGQLRAMLKHYYTWQGRLHAPLGAVRVPPQPRMVCQALEPDEARALVAAAVGWWPQGAAVLLGMYLALRREEIAKAQWGRFDPHMEWYTVTGKRDKTATIPVHPLVKAEFEPHRSTGWVFPGRQGIREYVHPTTVWSWTKEVARAAGLDDVRTHQLRHTSLTTALDNTDSLRSVMEFARHERPQTTAGYTRTTKEQLLRVSEALTFY